MKIGLIGMGTIGSGVYEHLTAKGDIEVKRILEIKRHPGFEHLETSDYDDLLNDPEIDTIVELMGGVEPAKSFTLRAFAAGKNVVSANKLMLSGNMEEILNAAKANRVEYRYDASVGGSIPVLYNLMRYKSAETLQEISGIVNGTTNLILDVMQHEGRAFGNVLKEAQQAGYAEANPTADIDGIDARCKIGIAGSLACGSYILPEDIDVEGIRFITDSDIQAMKSLGLVCRLIATAKGLDGAVQTVYVEPTLVKNDSIEAAVHQNNNVVCFIGKYFGEQYFYGQGAGKDPTAVAVELGLRDIADGITERMYPIPNGRAAVDNSAEVHSYYVRCENRPEFAKETIAENTYITEPISVKAMHQWAKAVRESGNAVCFAGIR